MRKAFVLLAPLLLLGGCLDYDEVVSIAADGSGSVRIDFTVDLAFAEKLRKLSVPAGEKPPEDADDPYKMMVTKEEVLKNVQGVDGVTVKQILVEDLPPTKTHVKLALEFASLDALRKTKGFAYRELAFTEKDGAVAATYKVDVRFLKELALLPDAEAPAPETDLEKKMGKTVDDATADAAARFTVHFPAKLDTTTGKKVEGDDKAARLEVAKKDAKAHAAVAKEPLVLEASFAKAGNEALLKKPESKKEEKKAPPPPEKKDGD
jgi:hypothetical protein